MSYAGFLRARPAQAAFGFGLNFFSCFGQTFFLSLFVPAVLRDLQIEAATFGTLYAAATLAAAAAMMELGRRYDATPLPRYTTGVILGLAVACGLLSVCQGGLGLFVGLFALRLFGQGLVSHVAHTTLGKTGAEYRGVALSLVSLGYMVAEMTLPLVFGQTSVTAHWRSTWFSFAVFCAFVVLPIAHALLRHARFASAEESASLAMRGSFAGSLKVMGREPRFWRLLPIVILIPLTLTAVLLYQMPIALAKGWSATWMAGAFTTFAVFRTLVALAIGPWLDRIGPWRLIAWSTPCLPIAFALLAAGSSRWTAPVFYAFLALPLGATSGALTAVWADIFGRENLGTVRSFVSTLTIVSSAAGPVCGSLFLASGAGFASMLATFAVALALAAVFPVVFQFQQTRGGRTP